MEYYQLDEENLEQKETDSWYELQFHRLQYFCVILILVNTVMLGTQSSGEFVSQAPQHLEAVEEFVEASVKDILGYGELDQAELSTLDEALEENPQFAEVYEYIDQRFSRGEINELQKRAVQHALNRELWRYFREPLSIYLTVSQFKNQANGLVKADNPSTSLGMTDLRANRITKNVYDHLPASLQSKLLFDKNLGHVLPESLAEVVTTVYVTDTESVKVAADVYAAIVAAHQKKIDEVSVVGNFSEDQKIYLAAMLACCSTSPQHSNDQFAFLILDEPSRMERHWESEVPQVIKTLIATQEWPQSQEKNSVGKLGSIIRDAFLSDN